jgi:Tfp pilus assembly protein PilX
MSRLTRRRPSPQHGAASLVVVMMLFFLMMLVTAYASRGLVFEQRSSAHQYRATQAFEAASAGRQWALALLNGGRIDAACEPSDDPAHDSFLQRYVTLNDANGQLDGSADADQVLAACVHGSEGWQCACPAGGQPTLAAPEAEAPAPSFSVVLRALPEPQAGLLRLQVLGCSTAARPCQPASAALADAAARQEVQVGLLPGLAHAPQAALTAKAGISVPGAALRLINLDPDTGTAVHAGGPIDLPLATVVAPPGSVDPLIRDDTALAAMDGESFFAAFFGVTKAVFRSTLPAVHKLQCSDDCTAALGEAAARGARMLWVGGDLVLPAGLALGSATAPVILVVDGQAAFNGAVQLHGLLYARSLVWNGAGPDDAFVNGAVVIEADCCAGNGAPSLGYDTAVLARLRQFTGSFAAVPGSWRDRF